MNNLRNRLGIVKITAALIIDEPSSRMLSELFCRFFPIQIMVDEMTQVYSYQGYSESFGLVNCGDSIPEYMPVFKRMNNGETAFSEFQRLDSGKRKFPV